MTGRNETCPCGSGRKYKRCCGAAPVDEADDPSDAISTALRWLNDRHRRAMREALDDIVAAWLPSADALDEGLDAGLERMVGINASEWLLADDDLEIGGEPMQTTAYLLAAKGLRLGPRQRAFLAAIAAEPLKLYTITDVRRGEGLTLVDAFDADAAPRVVTERAGSRTLEVGMLLGARVVAANERLELSGAIYPFAPLWESRVRAGVAAMAERAVDDEERRYVVGFEIACAWMATLLEPPPMPRLVDASTGEPIAFTTDRYAVEDPGAVRSRLDAHAELTRDGDDAWAQEVVGADGLTRVSASLALEDDGRVLTAEYRTVALADRGRPWLEEMLGPTVRFVARETLQPRSMEDLAGRASGPAPRRARGPTASSSELSPETMTAVIGEAMRRTYANWADEPIPALNGQTPREAARTSAGAERVRGLLRSYEAGEARQAREQGRDAVDFGFLWTAVGLGRSSE